MPACRSCQAPIVWGITESGKPIPLDKRPTSTGNVVGTGRFAPTGAEHVQVIGPLERELLDPDARAQLRMPHHATCPQADAWRR